MRAVRRHWGDHIQGSLAYLGIEVGDPDAVANARAAGLIGGNGHRQGRRRPERRREITVTLEGARFNGSQQREYPWGATDPGTASQYAIYDCYYPNGSGTCAMSLSDIAPVGSAALGAGSGISCPRATYRSVSFARRSAQTLSFFARWSSLSRAIPEATHKNVCTSMKSLGARPRSTRAAKTWA